MRSFKIFCGTDTNGNDVNATAYAHNLAAKYFPNGHTVYNATGRWMGEVGVIDEPTIVVEVITEDTGSDAERIRQAVQSFAGDYKFFCYQESVMITCTPIEAWFV